jgi:hypothetical protein
MTRVFLGLMSISLMFHCLSGIAGAAEPNLVAHWKFDEASGYIAYDSVGTNNGYLSGGLTWITGFINGALSFDGQNDDVECGSGPSSYENITASVWMKTATKGALVSDRYYIDSYGTWYTLFSTSIEIGDNTFGGYRNIDFNTPTLDSQWHHIVYTKDGSNHAIYVDGVIDQSFFSNADISSNATFFIGKRWSHIIDGTLWFKGTIDDVRIYNRALFAEEIMKLYFDGLLGKAYHPNPLDGKTCVDGQALVLSWTPRRDAVTNNVYFGTDFNEVNYADIYDTNVYMGSQDVNFWDTNNYDLNGLSPHTMYYWRIDGVNEPNLWKGRIWNFKTGSPFIEASSSKFDFRIYNGYLPPSQILRLRNSCLYTLNWQIDYDCNWLIVEPNKGSSSGEINEVMLSIDANGLPIGSYVCYLIVSDPNAENSPQTIEVYLLNINCFPSTTGYTRQLAEVTKYLDNGKISDCWCSPPYGSGYQCDGDADGGTEVTGVNFRVYNKDLSMLSVNWKKKITDTTLNPCADFDHKQEVTGVNYRVYNNDLRILTTNWKKKGSSSVTATNRLPGNCPRNDGP